MPTGFQCINDYGVFQIDDTYKNIQLKTKTNVTSMTQVNTGSIPDGKIDYWYYDIVVTSAGNPVIAINGNTTQYVSVGSLNISGGTWTFRVFSDVDADFTYYVFDNPTSSGSFGLEVRNSSNEVQYSSGLGPFRVTQKIVTPTLSGGTTTLPSGKTYAIVFARPGYSSFGFSNPPPPCQDPPDPGSCEQYYYLGAAKLNGVTLTTDYFTWFQQARNDDQCGFMSGSDDQELYVIDVTNL
jgi:hypothetical protein